MDNESKWGSVLYWRPLTWIVWMKTVETYFKSSSFVFHRIKKVIQVWNGFEFTLLPLSITHNILQIISVLLKNDGWFWPREPECFSPPTQNCRNVFAKFINLQVRNHLKCKCSFTAAVSCCDESRCVSKSSCLIDCLLNSNVLFHVYASVNPPYRLGLWLVMCFLVKY